ncbi:MAG TPA: hypothetical protein VG916_05840 [Gemmatimonadaceae bacterium]|nr:hypothetical protein [Gemmatimonadaceae bacterium]
MTQDELIRVAGVCVPMLLLALGALMYHRWYVRANARDEAEERTRTSREHAHGA